MRCPSSPRARFPTCATASSPFSGASSTRCARWDSTPRSSTARAPASSARCSRAIIRTATRRCTTRSCGWRKISRCATRSSTVTATSARSIPIRRPHTATRKSRLARPALDMLADIDKETVDFVPNFDNQTEEPVVLPGRLPQLLINGSSGIAVGMATNIPPHNVGEICDAIIAARRQSERDRRRAVGHRQRARTFRPAGSCSAARRSGKPT